MGKTLIIAEKPSQARAYAKALNVGGRGEEGFIADDKYVITWCIGHLLELEKPEKYMDLAKVGNRWSLLRLPVLPTPASFRYALKPGTSKQYQVIINLLKLPDISDVICGTDADREGQLLFQEVWDRAKCVKPLQRLWVSSLTDEAIREGMAKLRPASNVEGLAAAGYGRAFADWDFGMNLTEGFTALFGSFDSVRKKPNVISIGRVQTPTLALVVEREWEVESFQSVKYYEVKADFKAGTGSYTGTWFNRVDGVTRLLDRVQAETLVQRINGRQGNIEKLTEKEVQEVHPLLFDLTSLTITAARRYGFGAEMVLNLAQSLYEKKAITYPRTDCNYLPSDILPKLPAHLHALEQEPYMGWVKEAQALELPAGKRVINQITAHHAIIPTTEKVVLDRLTPDESKLYDLIVRRFLAVWFPPARYHQIEVITQVEGESFRTKGKTLVFAGWKQVYTIPDNPDNEDSPSSGPSQSRSANTLAKGKKIVTKEQEDAEDTCTNLPSLQAGAWVQAEQTRVEEKDTKPPKRFTQADLLKAMESAGKQVEDELLRQQLKGKGLGTVATRPAIIGNLLNRGYLSEEQRVLKPTTKGMELIKLIKERLPHAALLISAEMTGQMENDLSRVGRGELTLGQYMGTVEDAIKEIIEELRAFERANGKVPLALAPTDSTKATRPASRTKTVYGNQTDKSSGNTKTPKTRAQTSKAGVKGESSRSREEVMAEGRRKTRKGHGEDTGHTAADKTRGTAGESAGDSAGDPARGTGDSVKGTAGDPARGTAGDTSRGTAADTAENTESLGKCPLCAGDIIEGKKGYGCGNWRQGCSWVIWKSPICGQILTPAHIKALLKRGKTPLIKGFQSKAGRPFAAYLAWEDKRSGKLKFEFQERA